VANTGGLDEQIQSPKWLAKIVSERLDRDVSSIAVAEAKTVSDGLFWTGDTNADSFDVVTLNPVIEGFSRESVDPQGKAKSGRDGTGAWDSDPDFARPFGGESWNWRAENRLMTACGTAAHVLLRS
jgi:hypothetical protein